MSSKPRTRASTGTLPSPKKPHMDEEMDKSKEMSASPPPQLDEVEGPVESGFDETEEDFVVEGAEEVVGVDEGDSALLGAGAAVEGHEEEEEDEDEDGLYDDPSAPVYSRKALSFNDVEKILLGEERVPKNRICQKIPPGIRERKKTSGTYVIDLASVGDFKNVLNDGLAPWYAGYGSNATSGSLTRHYVLNHEGKATRVDKQHRLPQGQKSDLRIARTFYTNKAAKALGGRLVRMIYRCLARNGQLRRFVVVTYEWKSDIVEFESANGKDVSQSVVYPIDRPEETPEGLSGAGVPLGGDGSDDIFLSHDDLIASRVEVEEDEESGEEEDEEEVVDPECPLYAKKAIGFDDVEKILLGAERVPKNLICHKTPAGERERRKRQGSYIVDLASLDSPNDILSDNLGSWQSGTGGERASYPGSGSRMRYYLLKPDGGALRVDKHGRKPPAEITFDLKINRCLYTNRSAREQGGKLIRRIFRCYTRNGETRRFAVVTYEWIGKLVPFDILPPIKRGRKPGISPRRKGDTPGILRTGPKREDATAAMALSEMADGDDDMDGDWGMDVLHEDDIQVGASTTISPGPGGFNVSKGRLAAGLGLPRAGLGKRRSPLDDERAEKEIKVLNLQEKYYQYMLYKTTLEIRQINPEFEPDQFEESIRGDGGGAAAVNAARVVNTPQTRVFVVDPNETDPGRSSVGNSQPQYVMRQGNVGNVVQYGYGM